MVSGVAVLTAWLRQIDPIWWVLIGLGFFTLIVFTFERISAYRVRKQESQSETDDVAKPSDDHWADRRRMELMALANVASGRAPTAVPMSEEPVNSYYHVLREAVEDGRLKAKRTGIQVDYGAEVEYDDFCRFAEDVDISWVQELYAKWSKNQSKHETTERRYDTPIHEAIMYVARRTGDNDDQSCFETTRRSLRQAGLDGEIKFRGRKELEGMPGYCEDIHSWITQSYWSDHVLNDVATYPVSESFDHTQASDLKTELHRNRYWTVRVNMDEIKKKWP